MTQTILSGSSFAPDWPALPLSALSAWSFFATGGSIDRVWALSCIAPETPLGTYAQMKSFIITVTIRLFLGVYIQKLNSSSDRIRTVGESSSKKVDKYCQTDAVTGTGSIPSITRKLTIK